MADPTGLWAVSFDTNNRIFVAKHCLLGSQSQIEVGSDIGEHRRRMQQHVRRIRLAVHHIRDSPVPSSLSVLYFGQVERLQSQIGIPGVGKTRISDKVGVV